MVIEQEQKPENIPIALCTHGMIGPDTLCLGCCTRRASSTPFRNIRSFPGLRRISALKLCHNPSTKSKCY
jgi:hypothetical protein